MFIPNLFLDQFAYEIWHYGIAGHEGHSGEPGWAQAKFFFGWLATDGIGLPLLLVSLIGIVGLASKAEKGFRLVIAFPILYFLFISEQRANFTRNILVLIPFVALFAAIGVDNILKRFGFNRTPIFTALLILLSLASVWTSFSQRASAQHVAESRTEVLEWIRQNPIMTGATLVAGNLQLSQEFLQQPSFERIDIKKITPSETATKNATRIIVAAEDTALIPALGSFQLEKEFAGAPL